MSAKSTSNISPNGMLNIRADNEIPQIMADKTVGFGWDSANHGRQDSRIWSGFRKSWQRKQ
jgi:hypothetical protein